MAKYDDLNTRQIFIVGIASVFVTVVTILAAQYVYYLLLDSHQAVLQAESSYGRQNAILAEQFEEISKYGADPLTGNVTIPISAAMEFVVEESRAVADKTDADKTDAKTDADKANADDKDAT